MKDVLEEEMIQEVLGDELSEVVLEKNVEHGEYYVAGTLSHEQLVPLCEQHRLE